MDGMFEECKNLKYLNLKGCSKSSYDDRFFNTPEIMVACFPDDSENRGLRELFSEKTCEIRDLSGNWKTKQKKKMERQGIVWTVVVGISYMDIILYVIGIVLQELKLLKINIYVKEQ